MDAGSLVIVGGISLAEVTRPNGLAIVAGCILVLVLGGCGERTPEEARQEETSGSRPPAGRAATQASDQAWTLERAHTALADANPGYDWKAMFEIQEGRIAIAQLAGSNVMDLSPLKEMNPAILDLRGLRISDVSALEGLSLDQLYLEGTGVRDLSPLRGMRLARLYLNDTPVADLTPLEGMPLQHLNLFGTAVTDITPLKDMPLEFLWLNGTGVSDISALAGCPLVSLTLQGTMVTDLTPLAGSELKRLHIGDTPVTDLTPIKSLALERLIFTPRNAPGWSEIVRGMESLTEIGTTFENRMPPEAFWALHAQGEFE
jgi:hypothetical protein